MTEPRAFIDAIIDKYRSLDSQTVACETVITDIVALNSKLETKCFSELAEDLRFLKSSGTGNLATVPTQSVVAAMLKQYDETLKKADLVQMERGLRFSSAVTTELERFLEELSEE